MNNYKFGNYICKLREEKEMTQSELAQKLDVSDKAVSKWENGQAIPRMDTFEKLAEILGTTIDDILSASKDGVNRICFVNNFCSLITLDINGQILNIKADECKWLETNDKNFTLKITGDIISDNDFEDSEKRFKEALKLSYTKLIFKHMTNLSLQANCVYKLTNVKPDSIVNINLDVINLGYKAMSDFPFLITYPKIDCDCEETKLLQVKGTNSKEVIKRYTYYGTSPESGIFFLPDVFMPIRNLRFRHLCKQKTLKKNILKADYYHEKNSKVEIKQIKGRGCLSLLLLVVLCLFFAFFSEFISMEEETNILVTADYETIIFYGDVYERIDDLPKNIENTNYWHWKPANIVGLTRFEKFFQDNCVTQFKDNKGRTYLWLVEDIPLTGTPDYDDFKEHYVYVCKNPKKILQE